MHQQKTRAQLLNDQRDRRLFLKSISSVSSQKFWIAASKRDASQARTYRQKKQKRSFRKSKIERSLSKREKYIMSLHRETRDEILQSKRRAVLIHEDGAFSPIKMLPFTDHPHGVIGSFLGGVPVVVASHARSGVVMMGLQDSICDEEWSDDANKLIQFLGLDKKVEEVFGRALCFRLTKSSTGQLILGDLQMQEGIDMQCARQIPASYAPENDSAGDTAGIDMEAMD